MADLASSCLSRSFSACRVMDALSSPDTFSSRSRTRLSLRSRNARWLVRRASQLLLPNRCQRASSIRSPILLLPAALRREYPILFLAAAPARNLLYRRQSVDRTICGNRVRGVVRGAIAGDRARGRMWRGNERRRIESLGGIEVVVVVILVRMSGPLSPVIFVWRAITRVENTESSKPPLPGVWL